MPAVPRPPRWWRRQVPPRGAVEPRPLRLLIFHWDEYPTAKKVYREEFVARGHRVSWVLRGEAGDGDAVRFSANEDGSLREYRCDRQRDSGLRPRPLAMLVNRWRKTRHVLRKGWYFLHLAQEERFDLVQARDTLAEGFLAWVIARLTRAPFCFQLDFMHFEGYLWSRSAASSRGRAVRIWWRAQARVRDWLLRRADLLFVISEEMRRLYISKGVDPERCVVFPVGVDPRLYDRERAPSEKRRELGLCDRPSIVYLGTLGYTRDAEFLFAVMREVLRREPEARFLLLCKVAEASAESLVPEDLREAVSWLGSVSYEEVPSYLAAAELAVYPIDIVDPYEIHWSMSPLKVAEYMAAGLPVVSAPNPEARELLQACDGGHVVPYDAAAYAEAVSALLSDPVAANAMGARGREYISQFKSFSKLAGMVEQAYARLLSEAPRGERA